MQTVIRNPRNGCALHGAIQTIEEIRGVVPIVHSNAGCTIQNYLANKASGLGNGYVSGASIPSTSVQERHVIFGGASRLREQIKNTIKVVSGDLYLVLNSCESAMVGDDIAPNAALNLVFSKWGIKPAEKLEELHEIPKLVFSSVPIGIKEVRDFVEKVAGSLNLQEETINTFLQKEEETFRYYFQGIADSFFEEQVGKVIALVGDESTVLRIGTFVKEYLGAIIDVAVVTDGFPGEDGKIKKSEELKALANEVYFTQDGREIDNILVHSDVELILGSSLEDGAAKKKETVNLEISYPVYHKAILNKTYAGVNGALALTEDYISKVKEYNRLEEERLLQGIRR